MRGVSVRFAPAPCQVERSQKSAEPARAAGNDRDGSHYIEDVPVVIRPPNFSPQNSRLVHAGRPRGKPNFLRHFRSLVAGREHVARRRRVADFVDRRPHACSLKVLREPKL